MHYKVRNTPAFNIEQRNCGMMHLPRQQGHSLWRNLFPFRAARAQQICKRKWNTNKYTCTCMYTDDCDVSTCNRLTLASWDGPLSWLLRAIIRVQCCQQVLAVSHRHRLARHRLLLIVLTSSPRQQPAQAQPNKHHQTQCILDRQAGNLKHKHDVNNSYSY